jgi:hypothetical protein
MCGLRCQPRGVVAEKKIPTDGYWGLTGISIKTVQSAGAKLASGRTDVCTVNRVYYRQLRILGRATHEAAIVYLGADERTAVGASPSGLRLKIVQVKLTKYPATARILTRRYIMQGSQDSLLSRIKPLRVGTN